MKANAPEKIYIDDPTGEFDDHWYTNQNNDSVEYTRTDAFIEKASKWIYDNAYLYVDGQIDIEDFKKAMKL